MFQYVRHSGILRLWKNVGKNFIHFSTIRNLLIKNIYTKNLSRHFPYEISQSTWNHNRIRNVHRFGILTTNNKIYNLPTTGQPEIYKISSHFSRINVSTKNHQNISHFETSSACFHQRRKHVHRNEDSKEWSALNPSFSVIDLSRDFKETLSFLPPAGWLNRLK